jgi:DUF1365 family protein
MTPAPAIYSGMVSHLRRRPSEHRLAYRIFSVLLDIDRLEESTKKLKFLSIDRFNLFSFHTRDRGERSGRPLRQQVDEAMRHAGLERPERVLLLTMPRVLGFAFNPLSVYYCYGASGRLAAMIWEVSNTFGQQHSYLIPVAESHGGEISQACAKDFYVSPFMDMALDYSFRFNSPDALMRLTIDVADAQGLLLTARYSAHRQELTDANLLKLFFGTPALPLRVVGGINWEALKLWRKGVGLRSRPPPPQQPITFVRDAAQLSAQVSAHMSSAP